MRTMKRALALLSQRERFIFILLMGLTLVQAALELAAIGSISPFLMVASSPDKIKTIRALNWIYEEFNFSDSLAFLQFLAGMAFVLLLLSNSVGAVNLWANARYTEGRTLALSLRLLSHYLRQPYPFFLNRNSSELGKMVLSEVGQVVTEVIGPVLKLMSSVLGSLAIVLFLLAVNIKIALLSAAILGGSYGFFYVLVRGRLQLLGAERLQANRQRFKHVSEAFGGVKDVKLLGKEQAMVDQFRVPAVTMARVGIRALLIKLLPPLVMQLVSFGGLLVITVALLTSRKGDISLVLPTLGVFAFAGFRLIPRVQGIFQTVAKVRFGAAAVDSLYRELVESPVSALQAPRSGAGPTAAFPAPRDSIVIDNVSFTYPRADRPALHGISLTIPANSTVGLIGSTGGGKTTLGDVILGLLWAQSGEIRIDGRSLQPGHLRAWMDQIGYVPQHIFLTDDTVARNIAFGVPSEKIDMQAVEAAARIANIHEFIVREMPLGYQTAVGERGVRLSGGQRQRIGIARALYQNPAVLLLDEATSALDTATESSVMAAIHKLAGTRTIILIAHRTTTLTACSKVFELQHGQVVRSGTYEELFSHEPQAR